MQQSESTPRNDEMTKEYSRVKIMVEKKLALFGSEPGEFTNLGDAISVLLANTSKKERELKMQQERLEFELIDLRKKRDETEQK